MTAMDRDGIEVQFRPLRVALGACLGALGTSVVTLHPSLDARATLLVALHEWGHALLHTGDPRIRTLRATELAARDARDISYGPIARAIEDEADQFAAGMLRLPMLSYARELKVIAARHREFAVAA